MLGSAMPWQTLVGLLPRNAALCRGILGVEVMSTGSGPCDEQEFDGFLSECGVDVFGVGPEGPGVLVVGHSGWSEDVLDSAIADRPSGSLRVYSQEMIIASLALAADVYEICGTEELAAFGEGHPVFEYLLREWEFDWPSTRITESHQSTELVVDFGGLSSPETGLLAHMGYHVGRTGLSPESRHAILDRLMGMRLVPASLDDTPYIAEWGQPMSPRRLQKTANCLATFAATKKRARKGDYTKAVMDWESDLAYLKTKYYTDLASRFQWPVRR